MIKNYKINILYQQPVTAPPVGYLFLEKKYQPLKIPHQGPCGKREDIMYFALPEEQIEQIKEDLEALHSVEGKVYIKQF
ncbi:MAG: hypothetical protein KC535_00935 [Nanoarchaeota archaeon]|nr:hypothetical protein [Nanoarchaeota archaeon]